jgi:hypothetical protein
LEKFEKEFGKDIFTNNQVDIYSFDSEKFLKLIDLVELDILKAYEKWRLKTKNRFYYFQN